MTTNAFIKKNNLGFISNSKNDFDYFSKEFINRVDEVITFNDMNEKSIKKIISMELDKYNNRNKLNINLTSKEINEIINLSEYNTFGVRKLKRVINKYLDNKLIIKA
jgi:ATP-dependent Clp protease ATP-binding subunit ClpA